MTYSRTLEEDILSVFYGSWKPLSLQEVWDRLSDQGICIPIQYLAKVIHILIQTQYLKPAENQAGLERYQPNHFIDRFIPGILKPLLRSSVKTKQAPKMLKQIAAENVYSSRKPNNSK